MEAGNLYDAKRADRLNIIDLNELGLSEDDLNDPYGLMKDEVEDVPPKESSFKGAPSSWVEDEDIWNRAKDAAGAEGENYSGDSYWAVVADIYKNMGEVGRASCRERG